MRTPWYSRGTQRFKVEPHIAAALPQLYSGRSLSICRFELLCNQLSKEVWLSSGELVACYTSDALTESITYVIICLSCI